jgi:hypothetical protein
VKPTPGRPIPPEVKRRLAELVGLGLTYDEAARAVEISSKSADRIMADPSYRKIANDGRRERESMAGQAAAVVRDLLNATNTDGTPNQELRRKGAELFIKNPKLLDAEDAPDDTMLPGVVLRFPRAEPGSVYRDAAGVLRGRPFDESAPVVFSDADLYRPEDHSATP